MFFSSSLIEIKNYRNEKFSLADAYFLAISYNLLKKHTAVLRLQLNENLKKSRAAVNEQFFMQLRITKSIIASC